MTASAGPRVRYDGDALVRIPIGTDTGSARSPDALTAMGLDVLSEHPHDDALVRVPAVAKAWLDMSGLAYAVVDPDLQATLDDEHARLLARPPATGSGSADFYDDFRELDVVLAHLDAVAAAAPGLVTVVELGESLQGRPIRGLRITRDEHLPVVVINGCQHAREWLTVSTTMFIAEALAAPRGLAESDPGDEGSVLNRMGFVVVPVVNPDGYVRTWEEDRLWRKNVRDGHGVDLNRNWGVAWGGPGSSGNPQSNNYRGTAPFSEPEAAALRDLLQSESRLVAHLDVHAYGQLVLYPWGFATEIAPDAPLLSDLADLVAQTLTDTNGHVYEPLQAADFYAASGNLPDWVYGDLGARSFTIEARPDDAKNGAGFVPAPAQIRPTAAEVLAATVALAEWAADAEPGEPGDDGDAPDRDDSTEPETSTGAASESGGSSSGSDSTSTGAISEPTPDGPTDDPGSDGTAGSSGEPGAMGGDDGCTCRASPDGGPTGFGLWLLVAGLVRRRRAVRRTAATRTSRHTAE